MEETLIKKIMPHSIEAEQSVIGSMLMDEEAIEIASEIVTEDDFYGNQYKLLYKAIQNLHKEGSAVDIVTLQERLKAMDVPEQFMSIKFLRDIVSAVPISGNVKEYAKIIKEKAVLRTLIKSNEKITGDCYTGRKNLDEILDTKSFEFEKAATEFKSRLITIVCEGQEFSAYELI